MEIEYGLKLNLNRAKLINPVIESLLSSITILPFTEEDVEVADSLRAHLKILPIDTGA